jgi:hypothetical protein
MRFRFSNRSEGNVPSAGSTTMHINILRLAVAGSVAAAVIALAVGTNQVAANSSCPPVPAPEKPRPTPSPDPRSTPSNDDPRARPTPNDNPTPTPTPSDEGTPTPTYAPTPTPTPDDFTPTPTPTPYGTEPTPTPTPSCYFPQASRLDTSYEYWCRYECGLPQSRSGFTCEDWVTLITSEYWAEICEDGTVKRTWWEHDRREGGRRACDATKEGPWGCCDGWERRP